MLRTTRLLASVLFVIAVGGLSARVGMAQDDLLDFDLPPCVPGTWPISVVAVENRSGCEGPGFEWFVQATNTSTTAWYKVRFNYSVYSGQGSSSLCTVEPNPSEERELAPGQCASASEPFPNPSGHPCDPTCCFPEPTATCFDCTKIMNASVQVIAWKSSAESAWTSLEPKNPTVCAISQGSVVGGDCAQCRLINSCAPPNVNYQHDFNRTPCEAGL